METQTRSKLLETIETQAEMIEKLSSLVVKLTIDNAEKENLIEFLLEGERNEKIIV